MGDKKPQATKIVRPEKRRDSLIVHCIARAMIASRGWEETQAEFEAGAVKVTNFAAAKVAPKATRVAGFVISWAIAMAHEGRDSYTITEYQRFWNETERQAYRLQQEFRELWPEYETPDELARQVVKNVGPLGEGRKRARLPLSVPVLA